MLCFRDKTWCTQSQCKKWKECEDALTEQVKAEAEKWQEDPPISKWAGKPDCFVQGSIYE